MSNGKLQPESDDPLTILKRFTNARIALGRAGISLPVKAHLEFQLAHALAKDAVNIPLDFVSLERQLTEQGNKTLLLQTQAGDQQNYLQRPDKGRLLNQLSVQFIEQVATQIPTPEIALIVADGLSSKAIDKHAVPFLKLLIPKLEGLGFSLSPLCLVEHGRVAIGDPIAEIFSAQMSVILIGERPGLSSPDSMGIYFTYRPKVGSTDAERNCISNIHENGLNYQTAIQKLLFLINEARRLKISGVHLKDETQADSSMQTRKKHRNFLLE
jgi:ethanolamine ammonia-lyase small subunit